MNDLQDFLGLDVLPEQQNGVSIQPQAETLWSDYLRGRLAAQIQAVRQLAHDVSVTASLMVAAGGMMERSIPPPAARSRVPPTTRCALTSGSARVLLFCC